MDEQQPLQLEFARSQQSLSQVAQQHQALQLVVQQVQQQNQQLERQLQAAQQQSERERRRAAELQEQIDQRELQQLQEQSPDKKFVPILLNQICFAFILFS